MDYAKAFHLVSKASKKSAVPCVLIGGFAINFYKVTRNTLDVDFLITKDDFEKIKMALVGSGYTENFATNVAIRMSGEAGAIDIDFMIVDEATRSKIIETGKSVEIVGERLIIPSAEHLIALKLHAIKNNFKNRMLKDMPDVIKLIENNKINFKSNDFKDFCLKHGTEEIYKKIMEFLGDE